MKNAIRVARCCPRAVAAVTLAPTSGTGVPWGVAVDFRG
jgi:hypothetical protein